MLIKLLTCLIKLKFMYSSNYPFNIPGNLCKQIKSLQL